MRNASRTCSTGGAHFYATYECADGKHIAVGAIEPQFYAAFLRVLGLREAPFTRQMDQGAWPEAKERLRAMFLTKSRDEWVASFEGVDACVSPVLSLKESIAHPHLAARNAFVENQTMTRTAPALRFSLNKSVVQRASNFTNLEDLRAYWFPDSRDDGRPALAEPLA
jgi:alpha-methylacyl-CoA racemase